MMETLETVGHECPHWRIKMNEECCDYRTARSHASHPFARKKAKGWGTGPLGLCWRLKCSVPHPFRFFLRKGWETTKASNITASVRLLDLVAQSVHSARR